MHSIAGRKKSFYPSPPTSTWPLPSHFWHSPLPLQEAQDTRPADSLSAPEALSPESIPMPWQTGQLPSPAESQSRHAWEDMFHLLPGLQIVIAFRSDVKFRDFSGAGFSLRVFLIGRPQNPQAEARAT
jgi:hypothetical protein